MRTTEKLSFIICLTFIALLGGIIMLSCASPPPADQSSSSTTVRQPTGNPETFWKKFSWEDLNPDEQELWGKLGWNKDNRAGKAPAPSTEDMEWDELSPEERSAAKQLGYSRFYWDSN